MAESLFLGLRLAEGVSLERFQEEFSVSFQEAFGPVCADLFSAGHLEIRDGFLRLAAKARILSNQVFVRFL
jgi:oxygen-independent coproporphyrinogen-3 oxidase